MSTFSNNLDKKISSKYFCENCDYGTSKKSNFNNHCESIKHKYKCLSTNINENKPFLSSKIYTCDNCDKNFKERTGLWRHKKKCINETNCNNKENKDDLITLLLTQNK